MISPTAVPEIDPAALKTSMRLGVVAWVLFTLGLAWYFSIPGVTFPPETGDEGTVFSFTGFFGYMAGMPFAFGGLWTAVSKRHGMLRSELSALWKLMSSSSGRWKLAVAMRRTYLLLFVIYLVLALR
jgi:hypothetical protein